MQDAPLEAVVADAALPLPGAGPVGSQDGQTENLASFTEGNKKIKIFGCR